MYLGQTDLEVEMLNWLIHVSYSVDVLRHSLILLVTGVDVIVITQLNLQSVSQRTAKMKILSNLSCLFTLFPFISYSCFLIL